jgi:DNA-binding response OmpR family regulator
MASILAATTDPTLLQGIQQALADDHHILRGLDSLDNLADKVRDYPPDLVLLDLSSLPSCPDCVLLSQQVRAVPALTHVPILCVINANSAQDIALVLDSGGDDCLRKPFVIREMAARVRALLRRKVQPAAPLVLDPQHKVVQVHGRLVDLTPTEYDLLDALCQTPGEHLSASDLLEQVWNYPPGVGDPALVRNHVRNLRLKLERDPNRPRIVTSAHGRGYTVAIDILRR